MQMDRKYLSISWQRFETIRAAFQKRADKKSALSCNAESGKKREGLEDSLTFSKDVLAGKYGFMCQYNRAAGQDTVWSAIYDVGELDLWRCEGNPSRKRYVEDRRWFRGNCSPVE